MTEEEQKRTKGEAPGLIIAPTKLEKATAPVSYHVPSSPP